MMDHHHQNHTQKIEIFDGSSNSSLSPPASPYSRRHPKQRKQNIESMSINKLTTTNDETIVEVGPVLLDDTSIRKNNNQIEQHEKLQEIKQEEDREHHIDVEKYIFNFETGHHTSPYSRRYPASQRRQRTEQIDWTPSSSENDADHLEFQTHRKFQDMRGAVGGHPAGASIDNIYGSSKRIHTVNPDGLIIGGGGGGNVAGGATGGIGDNNNQDSGSELNLPVVLHRYQSMQSLRNRRDPHFQGNRSRRARRVVDKSGERNVEFVNIPQRSWRFFKDFVTTLIDEQWRYVITVFALSYFVCWILFAILWYLIAYAHGDLNFDPITNERLSDGPVPCVEGAYKFAGFLLFSIETQVSIGFGEKYPNEECPEAVFLMVAQIVTSIAIEGAMIGIVYAKMVRPARHSTDNKFSKKAVVCQRNSKLCLIFRVCDIRANHIIDTKIHAYWLEERISSEGERLRQYPHSLKLDNNGKAFLIFPTTICHVIDETSPLYDLSAKDLFEKRFEIIITMTGSSRSTGQTTQARTSYLPKEVLWGHRFANLVSYDRTKNVYAADYDKFDELEQIDIPLCSARRLDEVVDEFNQYYGTMDDFSTFDNEHLNYGVGGNHDDGDDKVNDLLIKPDELPQNHRMGYEEYHQNNTNYILQNQMEKLAEELEFKLSQHSLNILKNENNENEIKFKESSA